MKLPAWWFARQGLDGSLRGKQPADILEQCGWSRSVGGAAPYLTLFSRGRISRSEADAAAANLTIHELPAARGCTYVLRDDLGDARSFSLDSPKSRALRVEAIRRMR